MYSLARIQSNQCTEGPNILKWLFVLVSEATASDLLMSLVMSLAALIW